MESYISSIYDIVYNLYHLVNSDLWNHISNGHTTIIVLVSIAIALTITMGTAILIRQQKILRKLDQLTRKTEETSARGEP